jgi:hypothetical protein
VKDDVAANDDGEKQNRDDGADCADRRNDFLVFL